MTLSALGTCLRRSLVIATVLAPDAPWAKPAYSLLVERIHRTYLQSSGGQLPPEVEERLKELKQAIDGDKPSSAVWPVNSPDKTG